MRLKGHNNYVHSVSFSADGKLLASGSDDRTIKLWDVASGQERGALKRHKNGVSAVAFSSDGKTLASGSADHTIKLWDLSTLFEEPTAEPPSHQASKQAGPQTNRK